MKRLAVFVLLSLGALGGGSGPAHAQVRAPYGVELSFDRYYRYEELLDAFRRIEAAYPGLVRLETIGRSLQGRELVVAVVTDFDTGDDADKPAMWIDANVHGNEIQGAEVVLYTLWRLTGEYGRNEELTRLLREKAFYLLPSQNPDGREYWFEAANTPSSSRRNQRPVDDDRDGLFDEDPPDDLDGDGSITTMWVEDDAGRYVRDSLDPDTMRLLEPDEEPQGPRYRRVGLEGIDDDGDGRLNEDPPGGDDMNRDWPADWRPVYEQFGAGPYPLSAPETLAIARFLLDHPNVAAVQSYHNAGGMILRGPGAPYRREAYPREDERVYRQLGEMGEKLLPHYRSMVIHADLYTVHGGFVNWTAEGLGVFSFTNELWTSRAWLAQGTPGDSRDRRLVRERLRFGEGFVPLHEARHPRFGTVLLGGADRWGSRTTPTFLLLEECHRNFAFTMLHADQMPVLSATRSRVERLGQGLYALTVEFENDRLLPTRSARARSERIGSPDIVLCRAAAGRVVAGGALERFDDVEFRPTRAEPERLLVPDGLPGHSRRAFRFVVEAPPGTDVWVTYRSEKAQDRSFATTLGGE